MALDLRPPEFHKLTGRWAPPGAVPRKITLLLRVFTLEDISWLLEVGEQEWFERCNAGNVSLTIQVLAHQLENEEELRQVFGDRERPLEKVLSRNLPTGGAQLRTMVQALLDLSEDAMPRERAKKKWRRLLVALAPYSIGLLVGSSIVWAAAWMLSSK